MSDEGANAVSWMLKEKEHLVSLGKTGQQEAGKQRRTTRLREQKRWRTTATTRKNSRHQDPEKDHRNDFQKGLVLCQNQKPKQEHQAHQRRALQTALRQPRKLWRHLCQQPCCPALSQQKRPDPNRWQTN